MADEIPPYRQRAGAVTIRELAAGLIWPELFRVIGLSVSPPRVLIGTLAAFVLFGGAWLIARASGSTGFGALDVIWPAFGAIGWLDRLEHIWWRWLAGGDTWGVIGAVLWSSVVLIFGGATIARSAALDFATNLNPGVRKSAGFAFSRIGMLLGTALIPLLVIGGLVGIAKVFGLATTTWNPGAAIGGVLWFIPMGFSLLAVIVGALYVVGFVMLPGALACEDTDAGDAIQRVFAYLVSKPHRYVAYALVLLLQLWAADWLFQVIVRTGLDVAHDMAGVSESGIAADAINFWVQVAWLVFVGWALSYVFSGGALLYLLMRRACDEQDIREVRLTPVTLPEAKKVPGEQTPRPSSADAEEV